MVFKVWELNIDAPMLLLLPSGYNWISVVSKINLFIVPFAAGLFPLYLCLSEMSVVIRSICGHHCEGYSQGPVSFEGFY